MLVVSAMELWAEIENYCETVPVMSELGSWRSVRNSAVGTPTRSAVSYRIGFVR